jgi:hypothetical protein
MLTKVIISSLLTQSVGALLFAAPQALKPSVEQKLRAQYPVTRVGANGTVLQAGQVLVVQLDGIRANPAWVNQSYYPNTFKKDGKKVTQSIKGDIIHFPVGGPAAIPHLDAGAKVYLTGIELKKEEIIFSVQSCGACNPAVAQSLSHRAALAFQFGKGYLESADYSAIQDTIGKVFAVDTSPPQTIPTTEQPQTAGPPNQIEQPPPPPPPDPPDSKPPPIEIRVGLTIDQVVAAMGQPERKAKVGNKDIYSYKDMKITFVDGKVTDIQ